MRVSLVCAGFCYVTCRFLTRLHVQTFLQKTGSIRKALKPKADLVFVTAPHSVVVSDVKDGDLIKAASAGMGVLCARCSFYSCVILPKLRTDDSLSSQMQLLTRMVGGRGKYALSPLCSLEC